MAIAFLKYLKVKLKISSFQRRLLAACPGCCLVKAFYSHKSSPIHMNPTELQNSPRSIFLQFCISFVTRKWATRSQMLFQRSLTPHHRQQETGTINNQYFIHRKGTKRIKNEHEVRGIRHLLSFFHPFPPCRRRDIGGRRRQH